MRLEAVTELRQGRCVILVLIHLVPRWPFPSLPLPHCPGVMLLPQQVAPPLPLIPILLPLPLPLLGVCFDLLLCCTTSFGGLTIFRTFRIEQIRASRLPIILRVGGILWEGWYGRIGNS